MKKVKVALVGCGGRAGVHINSLLEMDDIEVVAVADPVEERRNAAAEKFGCKRIYKDHTELYANENSDTMDCVFISIEPTAHTDTETKLIEMGIPFLVEKPMTLDINQAREISKAIDEKKLVTAVGFQDRYLDLMDKIKEDLPNHKQGGLVYGAWVGGIPGVWWWQKKTDCGGQLVEQNIHLLDGLRYLFGEPLSVYATCTTGIVKAGVDAKPEYDTDDHSTAVIRFNNNVTATVVSACYTKGGLHKNGLVVTLDDVVYDYRLRNNLTIKTKGQTIDVMRGVDQSYLMARDFIDAVIENNPNKVRSSYQDALKSLELGLAANESMESGKVIYFN